MSIPALNAKALHLYPTKVFTFIPLHHYKATRTDKKGRTREVGKAPKDFNWTQATYNSASVLRECLEANRNVGVRLDAGLLVIDVDPRNGGAEGWNALCEDLFIDPKEFPAVRTGSGGFHFYMTKPADIPVRDTLEDYPGVEFKSKGRQVVAAGSRHPNGNLYEWMDGHPPITELPAVPGNLLKIIKRPQRDAINTGGGQYTPLQLARALQQLDPEDFREHDKWLKMMMACHHATAGDARHEFIEWSTLDPNYSDDAEIIGRRWDSLHTDRDQAVTFKTLNKFLADAGKAEYQVAPNDAGDDFDDEPSEEAPPPKSKKKKADWLEGGSTDDEDSFDEHADVGGLPEESLSKLTELNRKYTAVMDGTKFRVMTLDSDPVMGRDVWLRIPPVDFEKFYGNVRIQRDMTGLAKGAANTIKLGTAWLEWPGQSKADKAVFDPSGKEYPGCLQLWRGFKYTASAKGSWDRLRELLFEVVANGDQKAFDYMLNWLAFLFQHPDKPAEVAMVMKGGQGVGKGTLGYVVSHVIGRHALAIASPELITGRFNAHLQDVIFLFADEAIRPQDKAAEGRLKSMLTESILAFEGKGRDAITGRNYLHVMLASNESWVVPADSADGYVRRFFVTECNTKWQRTHDKFQALRAELAKNEDSGYRRFLWDMLQHKLPDNWHPRELVQTRALRDQKIRSFSPLQQFCFDACMNGSWPCEVKKGPWEERPVRIFNEAFRDAWHAYCMQNNIRINGLAFYLTELQQLFPSLRVDLREPVGDEDLVKPGSDGRARAVEIPVLSACRAAFDKILGFGLDWPSVDSNPRESEIDFG